MALDFRHFFLYKDQQLTDLDFQTFQYIDTALVVFHAVKHLFFMNLEQERCLGQFKLEVDELVVRSHFHLGDIVDNFFVLVLEEGQVVQEFLFLVEPVLPFGKGHILGLLNQLQHTSFFLLHLL